MNKKEEKLNSLLAESMQIHANAESNRNAIISNFAKKLAEYESIVSKSGDLIETAIKNGDGDTVEKILEESKNAEKSMETYNSLIEVTSKQPLIELDRVKSICDTNRKAFYEFEKDELTELKELIKRVIEICERLDKYRSNTDKTNELICGMLKTNIHAEAVELHGRYKTIAGTLEREKFN